MATLVSPPQAGRRRLVSFEGPPELVSAQLRLLPSSPQIRVLPSLQHYIKDATVAQDPFDPRQLIHRLHVAAQARYAEALEFFRAPAGSTDDRRVVFMHGGTAGAHAACLSAIMEHQRDGNLEAADLTFSQLVSEGVAGLLPRSPSSRRSGATTTRMGGDGGPAPEEQDLLQESEPDEWDELSDEYDSVEDPITRAMRAADELYKQTEFLQPASHDVDLTVKLIDIPPRPRKRLSAAAVNCTAPSSGPLSAVSIYSQAGERPVEAVPSVSAQGAPAERKPDSTTTRKPPLRIYIPSPSVPGTADVAVSTNRQSPSQTYHAHYPRLLQPTHSTRPRTAEAVLSPVMEQTRFGSRDSRSQDGCNRKPVDTYSMSEVELSSKPLLWEEHDSGYGTTWALPKAAETVEQPFAEVLPLLEDLVIKFSTDIPDEVLDFVFQRFQDGEYLGQVSPLSLVVSEGHGSSPQVTSGPQHFVAGDALKDETALSVGGGDGSGGMPWMRHGLPTPGHSPAPSDTTQATAPEVEKTFYSLNVGHETAVSIQNFVRSLLASDYPSRHSTPEPLSLEKADGLWKPLECDARRTASPDGVRRAEMILALGAECGVSKNHLSELVDKIEKLASKTSGLSRSGRLDLRYLIVNAMQAFTAQPLTKQTQGNPFSDPSLLAALIIPHLETYLSANPDVRFLIIQYPAEHLSTVLALQKLLGAEMMKIVGIVNSDAPPNSTTSHSADQAAAISGSSTKPPTPPQETFRALCPSGPLLNGFSVSKTSFLLASTATAFETAAFIAAIRESLASISNFYIPERPLYKHPCVSRQSLHTQRQAAQGRVNTPTKLLKMKPSPSSFSSQQKQDSASTVTTITPPSSPAESFPATAKGLLLLRSPFKVPPRTTTPHPSSSSSPWRADGDKQEEEEGTARCAPVIFTTSPSPRRHDHRDDRQHCSQGGVSASGEHDSQVGEEDGDDDDDDDVEERRLMPMYLRRRAGRRDGSKALKWLGLV